MTATLADRMKTYERAAGRALLRRVPVILRLDGRAFHSWTRGMVRPFDRLLADAGAGADVCGVVRVAGAGVGSGARRNHQRGGTMSDTTTWLTRPQLAARAGIPYPTAYRYTRLYADRLTSVGAGHGTRYHPSAVQVLVALRAETRRGRPPKTVDPRQALAAKMEALEVQQRALRAEVAATRAAMRGAATGTEDA